MNLSDVQKGSRARYAIFVYLTRDYPAAVNELREALKTEPDNIVLNRLMGYSLNKTGDSLGAKQYLDKYFSLVKPEKTLASDYINYGEVMIKLDQDSIAVENFLIAFEKDTSNIDVIDEVADNLRKSKKNEAAAKLYDVLLSKKENPSTNDYYKAGNAYLGAKQYEKADSAYLKVIEATPDNYLGYNALALSKLYQDPQAKLGTGKEISEKLIAMLEQDSTAAQESGKKRAYITACQYLASYFTQQEDLDSAKSYWDKVAKMDPSNSGPKAFNDYLIQVEKYNKAKQKQQKDKSSAHR
jgi:tetratricopeptide (TPR) repeat protein